MSNGDAVFIMFIGFLVGVLIGVTVGLCVTPTDSDGMHTALQTLHPCTKDSPLTKQVIDKTTWVCTDGDWKLLSRG